MTSPSDYFSSDYAEARGKFLSAAGAAGFLVESHLNEGVKAPDRSALYTDVVKL
ncbi:DUF2817 domain-containing protein, partial [bacterium AH-315-P15]|nr:DUF2817 domain-containing protein [bacterium AH-315-P15]